jgi:ribokinase
MITVFGSINVDISLRVQRFPGAGETVLAESLLQSPGGKGANQAHAAQLFGAETHLFGAIGMDAYASTALSCLEQAGVDTTGVLRLPQLHTGLATVTVNTEGENQIVVYPGANSSARAMQVPDEVLQQSRVLLLQLEVPPEECYMLARRARGLGCKVMLNASPLPREVEIDLDTIDMLVVNAIEIDAVCAQYGVTGADAADRAWSLARKLDIDVLVTLGAQGCYLAQGDGKQTHGPALKVNAIDTSGAGDAFVGVFAAAVATGLPVEQAMKAATVAAGLACMQAGTQIAQPQREQIDAGLAVLAGNPSPHSV